MNILRRKWVMDRRTFLRGTGVAIALPWLEAMGVHSTSYSKAGELAAGEIPARAVFTFWGMGMNPFTATPEQTGLDYVLPESVKPLEPFRKADDLLHRPALGHRRSFVLALLPHRRRSAQGEVRHLLRPVDRGALERQDPLPGAGPELHPANGFRRTGRRHAVLDAEPYAGRAGGSAASGVRPAVPAR